jgi:iron complex outermembrane receptor protein
MQGVFKRQGWLSIALALVLFCAAGRMPLWAQAGGSTLTGTILDQVGKTMQGATVTLKNASGATAATVETDADGHFSASVPAGTYSVETTAPGFARNLREDVQVPTQDLSITLFVDSISQSVTIQEQVSLAVESAPAGNTLETMTPKTEISNAFIKNFMAPTTDFAEVVNYSPGTFSLNPNGIGLGQGKTYFRGFQDGEYTITFDGIPFEDTNTPTHHSWASFPSQWISSTEFDRSPGMVSNFGPTNFGGSINLKSPELQADPDIRGSFSYGSFNTKIYSLDGDSGLLGPGKKDAILFNINAMTSDGYQTFNNQQRDAGYAKFQHRFSTNSTLSLYGGVVDIWNDTPNTTNPTRAQVALFGDNFLLNNCQTVGGGGTNCTPGIPVGSPDPSYHGYDKYHVQTDFEYADFNAQSSDGWTLDNKAYTTRYWNKQFYQNLSFNTTGAYAGFPKAIVLTTAAPSGVDKLNGYRHAGDTLVVSKAFSFGILRFGGWYDWAYTDRYQVPSNPITGLDTPLGNFHEHFITQTFQPFAEFEWHPLRKLVVTAGIKSALYGMILNQYQDNGKTVGCLGAGVKTVDPVTGANICVGGVAFVTHSVAYNNFLPNLSARYYLKGNWSAYAQFAEGSVIPPSAVFDVPKANVLVPPKTQLVKSYQIGSVLKYNRWTLDVDAYYVHFQNGYQSYTDPITQEPIYFATGPSNTKGVEGESNIVLGHGFSVYGNLTFGQAKYQEGSTFPEGGLWVANTPKNMETVAVLWQHGNWDAGIVEKRVGTYYNDNGSAANSASCSSCFTYSEGGISLPYPFNQAIKILPWDVENFFLNYTIKNSSRFRGTKIQFAANNVLNHHSITGVTAAVAGTPAAPYVPNPADLLNLLPARSFSITVTGGWAPRR